MLLKLGISQVSQITSGEASLNPKVFNLKPKSKDPIQSKSKYLILV